MDKFSEKKAGLEAAERALKNKTALHRCKAEKKNQLRYVGESLLEGIPVMVHYHFDCAKLTLESIEVDWERLDDADVIKAGEVMARYGLG